MELKDLMQELKEGKYREELLFEDVYFNGILEAWHFYNFFFENYRLMHGDILKEFCKFQYKRKQNKNND